MFGQRRTDDPLKESWLEQLEGRVEVLEQRLHFIEHPEAKEKARILDLQRRVEIGYTEWPNWFIERYSEAQIKRYSQEIADYYAKKAGVGEEENA